MSLKFFSKFDVRMIIISHMSFSKIFQILFIVGSTFPIFIPECLKNSQWWFSSSFSTFEDRRRVSFKPCSILCHPLIIVFDCENYFHPSKAFREFFPFYSYEGHHFGLIHSQLLALLLHILPVHHSSIL